jgi:hypothetical protein
MGTFRIKKIFNISVLIGMMVIASVAFIAEINVHSEPVQWEVNGHWYDAIGFTEEITWIEAFFHARKQTYQGLPGHLATLTSQEENDFVWQTLQPLDYWLGGFQVRRARQVDRGWRWITREPWYRFTNWSDGEPNDHGETSGIEDGEENFLQFWGYIGQWNDIAITGFGQPGYVIEYEEMPEQSLAPIKLKDIQQSKLTATWADLKQAR